MPKAKKTAKRARKRAVRPSKGFVGVLTPSRFVRSTDSSTWAAVNTAASAGTISLNNAGVMTLTTAAVQSAYYFSLGYASVLTDTPGYAELTALFDQYKLVKVELSLIPLWNTTITAVGAGNGDLGGFVHSVTDYDDNLAPAASTAGIQALMQYRSYRAQTLVSREPLKWSLSPKVASAVFGSGVFGSYASQSNMWIDAASTTVEHYGLKFIFEVLNPTAAVAYFNFRWHARYYLEARVQR